MADNKVFEEKNTELYDIDEIISSEEPTTLKTFGEDAKDNMVIFEKRMRTIIDGSSDDAWDDKVKTQINQAIDSIIDVITKHEKAALFISEAYSIVENMKTAEAEYVKAYDKWLDHIEEESTINPKEIETKHLKKGATKDSEDPDDYYTTKEYTDEYKTWLKEDDALKDTVPTMEDQGITWKKQVNNYFAAFDFETYEIDTSIYQQNNNPVVTFDDTYETNLGNYSEKEYTPVDAPAANGEEPIQEVNDGSSNPTTSGEGGVVPAGGDVQGINQEGTEETQEQPETQLPVDYTGMSPEERLEARGYTNVQQVELNDEFLHEYAINSKTSDDYMYWVTRYDANGQLITDSDEPAMMSQEEVAELGCAPHSCEVYTFEKDCNGKTYKFMIVYDTEMDDTYDIAFEDRVDFLISDIDSVPPEMTEEMFSRSPLTIKFSETPYVDDNVTINVREQADGTKKYDMSYGGGGGCARTASDTENLIIAGYEPSFSESYDSGKLLHELGHAYDQYSVTPGSNWEEITENELNPFLHEFAPEWGDCDWDSLDESSRKGTTVENFANCFREYCRNPERLKETCPQSYAAMDSLYKQSAANYGDNKYRAKAGN